MKLSLAWIFDHIIGSWQDYDITSLIKKLSSTTAEVEQYTYAPFIKENFTLVEIVQVTPEVITGFSAEHTEEYQFPFRADLLKGQFFLAKKHNESWQWATGLDFYSEKIALMPAVQCPQNERSGLWKNRISEEDYILHFDNKAITHRPDLWGHRGFAREIAAILQLPLRSEEELYADIPVHTYKHQSPPSPAMPYSLEIFDATLAKSLAGMYMPQVAITPSSFFIMERLLKVDAKPINNIVDLTNYVMFDSGQPLHAFDAGAIPSKNIMIAMAGPGTSLTLLDEQTVTLTQHDIVVVVSDGTRGTRPLGLAGVMGGLDSSVTASTTSLVVEAACFNPSLIRNTALAHKKRTESSSRFEKSLDPHNPPNALRRFAFLLHKEAPSVQLPTAINCIAQPAHSVIIPITHAYIERLIGTQIPSDSIETILQALEFTVVSSTIDNDIQYTITVPSFRSTKDVLTPQDIVEEITRFIGFDTIPALIPAIATQPAPLDTVLTLRALKNFLAFGAQAHEVRNYAFFDEDFLRILQWEPARAITVKNPVSEHWRRLVTSLIPHLIKNVVHNKAEYQTVNLFEYNTVWKKHHSEAEPAFSEQKMVAGIWFDAHKKIDFYEKKALLDRLSALLNRVITWEKSEASYPPWFHPYQTAVLAYEGNSIGHAGFINPLFVNHVIEGNAFIFELEAHDLLHAASAKTYIDIPKYPDTWLDVSMFIPVTLTVETITNTIRAVDPKIFKVELIDFFTKEEWINKRAVTMRFYMRDISKTLTTEDIDSVYAHVCKALKVLEIEIR